MKKLLAALLAAILALSCCASALGETIKHERVYVVTGPDGEIRSLTDSVRLENRDGLEEITDASLLTGIENMSGSEAFTRDGDALIWQAQGNDIVYQGASDQAPAILPAVSLTLDGEAVTAGELKNKTGEAVLTVSYQSANALPALAVTLLHPGGKRHDPLRSGPAGAGGLCRAGRGRGSGSAGSLHRFLPRRSC